MNMPAALFSTNLGRYAPRSLEHPYPPIIVRSNPEADKYAFIDVLRAKWPVLCQAIEPTFRICDYFDEVDAFVQGHYFLCDVLSTLSDENELRVEGVHTYADHWRKLNHNRFVSMEPETEFEGFFTTEESDRVGVDWLVDVFVKLKDLRQQASIAEITTQNTASSSNGGTNVPRKPHLTPSSTYAPLVQAQRHPSMPQIQRKISNPHPNDLSGNQGRVDINGPVRDEHFRRKHDAPQIGSAYQHDPVNNWVAVPQGHQLPMYGHTGYSRERIFSAPPYHNRNHGPSNINGGSSNVRGPHRGYRPVQGHLGTDGKPFKLQQISTSSVAARRARGHMSCNGSENNTNSVASGMAPSPQSANLVPRPQFNPNMELGPRQGVPHGQGHNKTWHGSDCIAPTPAPIERIPALAPPNPVVNPYDPSFVPGDVRMLGQGVHYYPPQFGASQNVGPCNGIYDQHIVPGNTLMDENPDQAILYNGVMGVIPNHPTDYTFQGSFLPPPPGINANGLSSTDVSQFSNQQVALPSPTVDTANSLPNTDITHSNDQQTGNESPELSLFVGHLPLTAGPVEVTELFSQFGTVTHVKIVDKGNYKFGFLRMMTPDECSVAINGLHKSLLHGVPIIVCAGRPYKGKARQAENYHSSVPQPQPQPTALPQFAHEPHSLYDPAPPPPGIWVPTPHPQAAPNTAPPRYDDPRLFSPEDGTIRLNSNSPEKNPPPAGNYEQGASILHFLRGPELNDSLVGSGPPVVNLPSAGTRSAPSTGLANTSPSKKYKNNYNSRNRNNSTAAAGPSNCSNHYRKNTNGDGGLKGSPMRRHKRDHINTTPNRHNDSDTAHRQITDENPAISTNGGTSNSPIRQQKQNNRSSSPDPQVALNTAQYPTIKESLTTTASVLRKSPPRMQKTSDANITAGHHNVSNRSKIFGASHGLGAAATGPTTTPPCWQNSSNGKGSPDRPATPISTTHPNAKESTPPRARGPNNSPVRQNKSNGQATPEGSNALHPIQYPTICESLTAIANLGFSANSSASTNGVPSVNGAPTANSATLGGGTALGNDASSAKGTTSGNCSTSAERTLPASGVTPANEATSVNGTALVNGAALGHTSYKRSRGGKWGKNGRRGRDGQNNPPKQDGNMSNGGTSAAIKNGNTNNNNRPVSPTVPRPAVPRLAIPLYQVNVGSRDDNHLALPPVPRLVNPLSAPLVKVTPPSDSGRDEMDGDAKEDGERRVSL